MPDLPTPEMLKRMKIDVSPVVSSGVSEESSGPSKPSKSRSAIVEDVEDEDADGVDHNFAPGGDADYFAEEDEEGRFYGGGLTSEQKDIINIFDKDMEEGVHEDVSVVLCPVPIRSPNLCRSTA